MTQIPASLSAWLEYISAQHKHDIDLGLARLQEVAGLLSIARPECPVITVAGTNGKGSSISALEYIYSQSGYRTGCYTSPHLTVFNERIRVRRDFVSDSKICDAFAAIEQVRGDIPLTYFEFATLAAFLIFAAADLDVVLLEVGLGGRLDATNLFPADLALITSISLDHMEWLGNDREKIGYEKAGIIHEGKVAVISDPQPPQSVIKVAEEKAGECYQLEKDFQFGMSKNGWWWKHDRLLLENLPYPGFRGKRQLDNLAGVLMCVTALGKVLPVSPNFIRAAIPQLHLPGRYQKIEGEPQLVLDVAHNPESVALLAENLQADPVAGKTHAVVAMLRDKDIGKSLVHMIPLVDVWYTAGLSAGRGETGEQISEIIAALDPDSHINSRDCPESAFDLACRQAKNSDRVVVFGSFHTVGAIIEHLSIDQQRLASPG